MVQTRRMTMTTKAANTDFTKRDETFTANPPKKNISNAIRLMAKALGIYVCFIYWGFVQEKVTTTAYKSAAGRQEKPGIFNAMITLNAFMAAAATIVGVLLHQVNKGTTAPFSIFWRPALSNTLASPIGYLSLRDISYPLLILVKNCKLLPVMLVGALVNGVRYKPHEYAAVALISCGVMLFMFKGPEVSDADVGHDSGWSKSIRTASHPRRSSLGDAIARDNLWMIIQALGGMVYSSFSLQELRGLCMAIINLLIDGFTNAEQDRINKKHRVSPYYMMAMVNTWSLCFALSFLLLDLIWRNQGSQLAYTIHFLTAYPAIITDILTFSFSNALGQVFIYSIIDEFGSLTCVTVTITRKIITLFISIVIYKHTVHWWQWMGVFSVFLGLCIKIFQSGGDHGHGPLESKAKTA
ncbi:udp-glc gal endoplasmic reticulum nucleotide sugar transporter [Nannochloropsis gaditana]|uniref:Udp-glc gal endoplasmic reticulum nucleotide sugar transporter n=1 Tax=Nannochloropsis gaditana TaxID=72520 RepID=W7T603_9STRA|nr:udp-glc gal endoplasmic reticulum nucleotide sugar transporter [Nannochloropsis gaditana]